MISDDNYDKKKNWKRKRKTLYCEENDKNDNKEERKEERHRRSRRRWK